MMNKHGKSDRLIVPGKFPNKARVSVAEEMEGRSLAKGNLSQQNAIRTQSRVKGVPGDGSLSLGSFVAPSELAQVRQTAKSNKDARFTALMHHIYRIDTLRFAYSQLKRHAAAGVDGETWRHYGEALEENLQDLSHRLKRGAYRAKPVRRVYIPKADGRQRPLGVTALEDKLVQRATVEVLNAIYETDFLGFSYGFRPGRSQHNAPLRRRRPLRAFRRDQRRRHSVLAAHRVNRQHVTFTGSPPSNHPRNTGSPGSMK